MQSPPEHPDRANGAADEAADDVAALLRARAARLREAAAAAEMAPGGDIAIPPRAVPEAVSPPGPAPVADPPGPPQRTTRPEPPEAPPEPTSPPPPVEPSPQVSQPATQLRPLTAADERAVNNWMDVRGRGVVEAERNWRGIAVGVAVVVVAFVGAFLGARVLVGSSDGLPEDAPVDAAAATSANRVGTATTIVDDLVTRVTLPPGPAEGLLVVEQGITVVPDRFDEEAREGTFAVIVENPHEDWLAEGVQVGVEFLDAAGEVLGTDTGFLPVVLPSQRVALASLLFHAPTEQVADMRATIDVARWRETGPVDGSFSIRVVDTEEATFSGVQTTFEITSRFQRELLDVGVTAVYRDASGGIIGGFDAFIETLAPGETATGTISLLANVDVDAVADVELYATAGFGFLPAR